MTQNEKVAHIRKITLAPWTKISAVLQQTQDVDEAIKLLIKQNVVDANDMANRKADNTTVHSYVHNNKVGAMIVIATQTDFVSKNELFLQLAKDICMHIVSTPNPPAWISKETLPPDTYRDWRSEFEVENQHKPANVIARIVEGKLTKRVCELCLINQPFIKDEKVTIQELINKVSASVGEKIEIKKFVRLSA